jgi:hypothetical protein
MSFLKPSSLSSSAKRHRLDSPRAGMGNQILKRYNPNASSVTRPMNLPTVTAPRSIPMGRNFQTQPVPNLTPPRQPKQERVKPRPNPPTGVIEAIEAISPTYQPLPPEVKEATGITGVDRSIPPSQVHDHNLFQLNNQAQLIADQQAAANAQDQAQAQQAQAQAQTTHTLPDPWVYQGQAIRPWNRHRLPKGHPKYQAGYDASGAKIRRPQPLTLTPLQPQNPPSGKGSPAPTPFTPVSTGKGTPSLSVTQQPSGFGKGVRPSLSVSPPRRYR